MYCGTCGAPLAAGARFCGQCGTPIADAPPAPGVTIRSPIPSARPTASYASYAPSPPMQTTLATPATPASAPRVSPFVAGLLECLVPGVGLLYAGSILAGSLVLAFTLLVGGLFFLNGLGMAPHVRLAALLSYFTCVGVVLLTWLVVRCAWAVRAARRRNAITERALAHPPAVMHTQPYTPPGQPLI